MADERAGEIVPRAVVDPRAKVSLVEPLSDLDQAWRVASLLAQSGLVGDRLRNNPSDVLVILMTGLELGLTASQSIRCVYVTKGGQPGLRGEMVLAKVREAGHDYDSTEPVGGATECIFRLHRSHEAPLTGFEDKPCGKGRDYIARFSVEDAERAGLLWRDKDGQLTALSTNGKPLPWIQYTGDLLYWRATARAIRRGCPEVTLGFAIQGVGPDEDGAGPPPPDLGPVVQAKAEPAPDQAAAKAAVQQLEAQILADEAPVAQDDTQGASGESQGGRDRGSRGAPPPVSPDPTVPDAEARTGRSASGSSERHLQPVPGVSEEEARERHPSRARSAGTPTAVTPAGSSTAPPAAPGSRPDVIQLEARFAVAGWDPIKYKTSVVEAATCFFRSPVADLAELNRAQVTALSAALGRMIAKTPEEAQPVVLADMVDKWREDWQRDDGEGYQRWKHG